MERENSNNRPSSQPLKAWVQRMRLLSTFIVCVFTLIGVKDLSYAQAQTATLSRFNVRTVGYGTGGLDQDPANHIISGERVVPPRPSDTVFPPSTRTFPLKLSWTWDPAGVFSYDGSLTLSIPDNFVTNSSIPISATASTTVIKRGFGLPTPIRLEVAMERSVDIKSAKTIEPFVDGDRVISDVTAKGSFFAAPALLTPLLGTLGHDEKVEQRFNLPRLQLGLNEVALSFTVLLLNNDALSTGITSCCGRVITSTIVAIYTVGAAPATTTAPPPITTTTILFPPPTTTTTIPPGAPTVDLDSPKTELRAGDSFILDLILRSGGSRSGIDLFFSIEIKGIIPVTVFLGPTLKFEPSRTSVVTNLPPIDASVRIFGRAPSVFVPSIFGEFIVPPNVIGSFTFVAEVVDSRTKASISSDRVTVNIR